MGVSKSLLKRRVGAVVNYGFLLITLLLGLAGHLFGWSVATKVGFWLSVVFVIVTFFPIHVRTGLWRLAHAKVDTLDEREIQLTLGSLRYAYSLFSIFALLVILVMAVFGFGSQALRLVVFWVLLYLAHTLPSSILAWTMTRVPAQTDE